jgi:hypothetical protein
MHSNILGFRYATSRWLALIGLSLTSFLLILQDLSLLRTLVFRIYRRKKKHTISIQAYTGHKHFITQYHIIKEYQKQTCLESKIKLHRLLVAS